MSNGSEVLIYFYFLLFLKEAVFLQLQKNMVAIYILYAAVLFGANDKQIFN